MRFSYVLTFALAGAASAWAQTAMPPAAPTGEDTANPLPRYMTPAERLLPIPQPARDRTPPSGFVDCPAEYEPCEGLFIAWEGYTSILTQIAAGATADPNVTVYVVVDSASEQTSAYSTLNAGGVVMSRVQFITRTTDTVWIRDYGPRFIFEDGNRAIVDHTYNRPRPNDDAFNDYLATLWNEPQYDIPLVHGGGNFHLFANNDAFMSSLILSENPGLSAADVQELYLEYQGLNLTIYPGFPTSFDSTQHIDMWMLPVGDNKIIIGQYAQSTGQPYTITEAAVADLTARGYTVFRTPGWNSGGTHYTYTNAVILNNRIMISKFNVPQDAQALATFQAALPGYTIQQIDSSSIIGAAGALHCVVMHVPESSPIPAVTVLSPNGGEEWYIGTTHEITWNAHDDLGVTGIDILLSTDGGATWPHTVALGEENDGTFSWTVPALSSPTCRVRIVAYDADGNTGEDTSAGNFAIGYAPELVHSFSLDANPGWTTTGAWAFGTPTGGGSHARDPLSGHTGASVYGYNLAGDYANNLPPQYLTTGALDCTWVTGTELRFWRWLGVEAYDDAAVELSTNGSTWTTVWTNTGVHNESAWTQHAYDIAALADGQPTVYLRWVMGPTDAGVTYPGWNLDDVEIWGVVAPQTILPGDADCDNNVDFGDINPFVLLLTNPALWEATYSCSPLVGDTDGNGAVDFGDINPFVALLTGR